MPASERLCGAAPSNTDLRRMRHLTRPLALAAASMPLRVLTNPIGDLGWLNRDLGWLNRLLSLTPCTGAAHP